MRLSRRSVLFLGFAPAIATPMLIAGCSNDSHPDPVASAADKEEQSFLQERIQKGFDKRPKKKAR